MRVTVKGKNVHVSDSLKAYVEKKLQKLSRYFSNIKEAQVTQTIQRNWHVIEVQVEGDGVFLRGEDRSPDMYACVDAIVEKLEKQVKRFKGKLMLHPREGVGAAMAAEVAPEILTEPLEEVDEEDQPLPGVVRTKRFAVKPMTPDEAAMQMELLNHDFFVFLNGDTQQINVLYRRKDGNYGLIEPEF
jgi:putative sigma-54 modulation protein